LGEGKITGEKSWRTKKKRGIRELNLIDLGRVRILYVYRERGLRGGGLRSEATSVGASGPSDPNCCPLCSDASRPMRIGRPGWAATFAR
jgi:hypothetical protein